MSVILAWLEFTLLLLSPVLVTVSQHVHFLSYPKGGFRGGAWGAEAPHLKFYNEQARKLLEAVAQVQLHFIHMYG